MKHDFPGCSLGRLCGLFGKTRLAIYDYQKRLQRTALQDDLVVQQVNQIRETLPRLGTRKLHFKLKPRLSDYNVKVGRDYLFRLLGERHLLIRRRRRKTITTDSRHWMRKYTNKVPVNPVTCSEMLWVSDITFIRLNNQWGYLSLITDAYSKKIMGWSFRTDLTTKGCLDALEMALANRQYTSRRLIHHSDRGSQYCSKAYVALLKKNKILISMTQNGDPYENALAERMNGILKSEFNLYESVTGLENTCIKINNCIKAYNEERPHGSCDMLVPSEAHNLTGVLKKTWKKYRSKKSQAFSKKEVVPALSNEQGTASSFTVKFKSLSSKINSQVRTQTTLGAEQQSKNHLLTV